MDAAGRGVKTYSGGMRRRLDLAASLIARPPSPVPRRTDHRARPSQPSRYVGRDPHSVADGTTVLLTTQYLDEADQLADRVAVVDHGRVIAEGTPGAAQSQRRWRSIQITVAPVRPPGSPRTCSPVTARARRRSTRNVAPSRRRSWPGPPFARRCGRPRARRDTARRPGDPAPIPRRRVPHPHGPRRYDAAH